MFAQADQARQLLTSTDDGLEAQEREATRQVERAERLIRFALLDRARFAVPDDSTGNKVQSQLKASVSATQSRIGEVYQQVRADFREGVRAVEAASFASPQAKPKPSGSDANADADATTNVEIHPESPRAALLGTASNAFREGNARLEALSNELRTSLNVAELERVLGPSSPPGGARSPASFGPQAEPATRGATDGAAPQPVPATEPSRAPASVNALAAGQPSLAAEAEPALAAAAAIPRQGIVGPYGVFDDPQASLVVYAPERYWRSGDGRGSRPFNLSKGSGQMGDADIAIRMDGPGEFSLKGVRVDSSKVAQASFAAISQSVRVVAAAYGVPLTGKTPDSANPNDANTGPNADAGAALRTFDAQRRSFDAATAQRRGAALQVLSAIANEADALAPAIPAGGAGATTEPTGDTAAGSLSRVRATFAAFRTSLISATPAAASGGATNP